MITIDVLVDPGCPHAEPAHQLALRLARAAADVQVSLVTLGSDEERTSTQPYYGSPTLLVNGRDIEGRMGPSTGLSCRIYGRHGGIPPDWMLEAALLRARMPESYLFLCVANSARSQMAEGIARTLAPEGVRVFSAGSQPHEVRPEAVQVLAELGIDISGQRAKSIAEMGDENIDAVITLCAAEVCPSYLKPAHRLHWSLPDPAGAETAPERLSLFREVRNELLSRLRILLQ